jgi:hypothetical protein
LPGTGFSADALRSFVDRFPETQQMDDKERTGPGTPDAKPQDPMKQARDLAGDAREAGANVAQDLRASAEEVTARGQQQAADRVEDLAQSLRRSADTMKDQPEWLSGLAARGATELSNFAEVLRSNDLEGLLRYAGRFAREQPALFTGASMALGFAVARFAKASVQPTRNDPWGGSATTSPYSAGISQTSAAGGGLEGTSHG